MRAPGDMIGRDVVTEHREDSRPCDLRWRLRNRHIQEGWFQDIGALLVECESAAVAGIDIVPKRAAF